MGRWEVILLRAPRSTKAVRAAGIRRVRATEERRLYGVARGLLIEYQGKVLANLARETEGLAALRGRTLIDVPPSILQAILAGAFDQNRWESAIFAIGREILIRGANETMHDPDVTTAVAEGRREWILDRTRTLVRSVKETQDGTLASLISEAIANGDSVSALTRSIRESFTGTRRYQASRIAITETGAFLNHGATESMKQAGVAEKEWLATIDDHTRETHLAANGQRVPVDGDFIVGSGSGPHPGMMGVAEEDIGCRCTVIAVV